MKKIWCVLLIALCLFGTVSAGAATKEIEYKDQNFKVTVDDSVLVMDQETNKYDPIWIESGIEDVEEKLDMMKQMNVLSVLFDTKTESLVNVICKMTEDTVRNFTFENKTDTEILAIVDSLVEGLDAPDENGQSTGVTYERSLVEHKQIPFFRLVIDINNAETVAKEVIYGTIVNGRLIEVDQYLEYHGDIDETFIKSVVDSVNITKFMTYEEYEEIVARGKRNIWLLLGVVVLMIVALFVFVTYNKKNKEKKAIRISDRLREFRE